MFNSVYTLSFSIDHANKDGSDITAEGFREAVLARINGLSFSDGDWELATDGPQDTYEWTD